MVGQFYKVKNYNARKSIGYLIRRGSNLLTAQIESLFVEQDLTFTQYVILMNLRDKLATNCGELCGMVRYDSGALTRVIDQLEKRKLLKRERCTNDRRVVKLHITELGRTTVESLLPLVANQYNEWLQDFTREDTETLIRLLTKLNGKIAATEAKG